MDIKNALLLKLFNYYRLVIEDISEESTLEEMHAAGVTDIQDLEKYLEKLGTGHLSIDKDKINNVMYDILDDCADGSYLCDPLYVAVTKGDEYVWAEISVTGTIGEHKVDLVLTSKSFSYSDIKNLKDLFKVMLEICEKARELKEKYELPDSGVIVEFKNENSINLPIPPAGYAPSAVVYNLHPGQAKEEFQKIIKAKTGVDVDIIVEYDDETYSVTARLAYECEESLSGEDYDKVFEAGYNFDEWYEVAVNLFTELFGTEVRAFAYESTLDESRWMIEVQVPIKP